MTVNVNLVMVCGFPACPWSMAIDRAAGVDPISVHDAYLEHLDEHDLADDEAECEAAEHMVNVAQAVLDECSSCHAKRGQPHTEYCKLRQWEAHDAEVARALAQDRIPAAPPGGGFYNGQLYNGGLYGPEPGVTGPLHYRYEADGPVDCTCSLGADHGLYFGDTPDQLAAEQARIDRFMAGDQDQ